MAKVGARPRASEPKMVAILALLLVVAGLMITWDRARNPTADRGDTLEARLDWARKAGRSWSEDITDAERARWASRIPWVEGKSFPLAQGTYTWGGGFGDPREDGARKHEGVDLMCATGTPVHSVGGGTVQRVGWLFLGGWRVGVLGDDGLYYYYAHLSNYAPGLHEGDRVRQGQVIGYAGDTGRGEEGTTGQMQPHLHFGMYTVSKGGDEKAIDPKAYLRYWEYASPIES